MNLISLFIFALASAGATTSWAANETFQAALKKLYPDCELKKEVLYLTKEQKQKISQLAGFKIRSQLANRYKTCNESFVYIDSHIVRTLNETVIVEVKDYKVKTYHVSAFLEPQEYKAPKKWLAQMVSKPLDQLTLFKKIDGLSGATLTAKANVKAARRILAMHQALAKNKKSEK